MYKANYLGSVNCWVSKKCLIELQNAHGQPLAQGPKAQLTLTIHNESTEVQNARSRIC